MIYPIEIPLCEEDAELFEATGEYRPVQKGEYILLGGRIVPSPTDSLVNHIIFSKKPEPYKWPLINGEPMKGWGFAMDADGHIFWYSDKPGKCDFYWHTESTETKTMSSEFLQRLGVDIPTITDWTKPVINPN